LYPGPHLENTAAIAFSLSSKGLWGLYRVARRRQMTKQQQLKQEPAENLQAKARRHRMEWYGSHHMANIARREMVLQKKVG